MKFALKEVIERIKWDPRLKEEISHIKIRYTHRGAPNDVMEIYFSEILRIDGSFLVIYPRIENEMSKFIGQDEDYIPFHRVQLVWNEKTGHIYYHKAKREKIE